MFQYLALLWNPRSLEAQHRAEHLIRLFRDRRPDWSCALSISGISVYYLPRRVGGGVFLLPERRGVVIGEAFPNISTSRLAPSHLTTREAVKTLKPEEIDSSRGQALVERIWGSYVAVLSTADTRARYVLRSPCGLLPCFLTKLLGINVIFSVVDDCLALRTARFSINWPVIRAQASRGDYLTEETALVDVTDLGPGERLSHVDDSTGTAYFWNPSALSQIRTKRRFEDAAELLRETTLQVTHAWASRYRTIAVQLSGGLDSSILLASLACARTAPRVIAANLYSSECPVDERAYAESMARRTRTPLVTIERASAWVLSMFLYCSRTARPALNFTAPGHAVAMAALAQQYACDAIFDGELGDNVFGSPSTAEPIADYLERYGFRPGVLAVARDLARLKRLSVWKALHDGFALHRSSAWRRSRTALTSAIDPADLQRVRFVTGEVFDEYLRESKRFVHPWLREDFGATPTALPLIYALISNTSTSAHPPFQIPGEATHVRPLISQPLVELALHTPGAQSIKHGWNRSLARAAFSEDLSEEVLLRTTKIDFAPWVRLVIRKNVRWLREFLLEGSLARERIVDVRRVTALLTDNLTLDRAHLSHLFVLAYIEGWLRQWTP